MIGAFPDLYPDELLCSGLARYEAWMAYPRRYHLLEDLFGAPKGGLCFDLPGRLGYLAAALPPGHSCTADRLIDDHTLLPFYTPLLTAERGSHIHREMAGTQATNIHGLVGLNTYRVPLPNFFVTARAAYKRTAASGANATGIVSTKHRAWKCVRSIRSGWRRVQSRYVSCMVPELSGRLRKSYSL